MTATTWVVETGSHDETQALGAALGADLRGGELILLIGDLGTGKTTLTQGLAVGLGVEGYTKSPSFVLVHEYEGRVPLYHADLFRIEGGMEAWELGLEEYLRGPGVLVVEWADRALPVFPPDALKVHLERISETQRRLTFAGEGPTAEIVERLRRRWAARSMR